MAGNITPISIPQLKQNKYWNPTKEIIDCLQSETLLYASRIRCIEDRLPLWRQIVERVGEEFLFPITKGQIYGHLVLMEKLFDG